jgi:general stress protein 26
MADIEAAGAKPDVRDRIWEIADRLDPCMLVTRDRDGQRVRPVFARVRRAEGRIYVLSDTKGTKLAQIEANPRVTLAFSDERANDYVVIYGTARILDDHAKIAELWRFTDKTFWETPDNPDLRLIAIEPDAAELWDGSNLLVTGAKIIAERLSGAKVALVENRKVDNL